MRYSVAVPLGWVTACTTVLPAPNSEFRPFCRLFTIVTGLVLKAIRLESSVRVGQRELERAGGRAVDTIRCTSLLTEGVTGVSTSTALTAG